MGGFESRVDRQLLGRVASLSRGQQRWLRTMLQSIFSMDAPSRQEIDRPHKGSAGRRRPGAPREPERPPRRQGVDDLLSGERSSEKDYPELADELQGIADIASLLRQSGKERRGLGEELMKLFETEDDTPADDEEENDEPGGGAHFN